MTGPLHLSRRAVALLLTTGIVLSGAGCASPLTSDATEETSAATSSDASPTPGPVTSTSTSSATPTPDDDAEGPQPGDEGRRLRLADFFEPSSSWEEERYDVADQKAVPGIAARVEGCYNSYQELELRLANNFDELRFSVAQANDSRQSDQSVSVEVIANNSQAEIRSVPFNEVQTFTVPVSGVNALKIRFSLDDRVEDCGGSVIAVVSDITVD